MPLNQLLSLFLFCCCWILDVQPNNSAQVSWTASFSGACVLVVEWWCRQSGVWSHERVCSSVPDVISSACDGVTRNEDGCKMAISGGEHGTSTLCFHFGCSANISCFSPTTYGWLAEHSTPSISDKDLWYGWWSYYWCYSLLEYRLKQLRGVESSWVFSRAFAQVLQAQQFLQFCSTAQHLCEWVLALVMLESWWLWHFFGGVRFIMQGRDLALLWVSWFCDVGLPQSGSRSLGVCKWVLFARSARSVTRDPSPETHFTSPAGAASAGRWAKPAGAIPGNWETWIGRGDWDAEKG